MAVHGLSFRYLGKNAGTVNDLPRDTLESAVRILEAR
jgi:hypothetical protein